MSVQSLSLSFAGRCFVLQDSSGEAQLARFARLCGESLGKDVSPWVPDVEIMTEADFSACVDDGFVLLHRYHSCRGWYRQEPFCLKIVLAKHLTFPLTETQTTIFGRLFTGWISLSSLLHGRGIVTAHGTLLETPRGGVLLCGESGVGKSTTCRRWLDAGQKAYGDDLILLAFEDDGTISAYPLPTWSRCEQQGMEKCFSPVTRRIPLAGALVLDRAPSGAKENLADVAPADFKAQFFRSLFFPILATARKFPDVEQCKLRDAVWRYVGILSEKFPPRILNAALDGDLPATLGEFL